MTPVARVRRMIDDLEVQIATVGWWNQHRTDAPPMDCESERVMLPVARACLAALEAGDRPLAQKLSDKMVELASTWDVGDDKSLAS